MALRRLAQLARLLAGVAAQADHLEAQLLGGDAGRGDGVGRVAEDEDALAGEVGAVDAARVPGQPRIARGVRRRQAGQRRHLGQEVARGADADRHGGGVRLAQVALEPGGSQPRHLGVEHHVEVGIAEPSQIGRPRAERRHHVHGDAEAFKQLAHLHQVVAVAEAERGWAQDVAAGRARRALGLHGEAADKLVQRLRRAPVLLLLVGRQVERDDRHRHARGGRQPARIVLDQLRRAGGADDDRLGPEALGSVAQRRLEQLRGVAAQITRLEGGVGDRRARIAPLDHGEEQIGVGVALRRVQHVVQPLHRGSDAHGAHMRRALIGPEGELHRPRPAARRGAPAAGRTARRGRPPARSPAPA